MGWLFDPLADIACLHEFLCFFPLSWPDSILRKIPIGFVDSVMSEAVVRGMHKEGAHVVLFSANLEFAVWDIHSVLTLAGVGMEDKSVFIYVKRVPDFLVFAEERILSECLEVALMPSGFLGLIPNEVWFIDNVVILDVLGILLFNFLLFLMVLLFLLCLCYLLCFLPPFLEVSIPR